MCFFIKKQKDRNRNWGPTQSMSWATLGPHPMGSLGHPSHGVPSHAMGHPGVPSPGPSWVGGDCKHQPKARKILHAAKGAKCLIRSRRREVFYQQPKALNNIVFSHAAEGACAYMVQPKAPLYCRTRLRSSKKHVPTLYQDGPSLAQI